MNAYDFLANKMWLTNPNDFLIIKRDIVNVQGDKGISYHIVIRVNGFWVSCIIEDDDIKTKLALEIIESGIKAVTLEESQKIRYPHIFGDK